MKIFNILSLISMVNAATNTTATYQRTYCKDKPTDSTCVAYNILALESAQYLGFMTAEFIDFLELIAYYSARDNYCIPKRDSGRIAMPELFDMISGSESGAIIASSLMIPSDDKTKTDSNGNTQINKYFASKTSEFYTVNAKKLYIDQQLPIWSQWLITISAIILDSVLVYICLHKKFKPKEGYEEKIEQLQMLFDHQKEQVQSKGVNEPTSFNNHHHLQKLLSEEKDLELHKINMTLNSALEHDRPIEILEGEQKKIEALTKQLQQKRYYKIGGAILAGILTYFLVDHVFIKLFSVLFIKNVSYQDLYDKMEFINDDFDINNILTNDFLFPAWDITDKNPVFFSKTIANTERNKVAAGTMSNSIYSMKFKNMVLASATNPNYFTSAAINFNPKNETQKAQFFGGNTVASSPALYSHFLTSHFKQIDTKKIRIVTIGNVDYTADKLSSTVGIVGWANRLYELTDPVKKYTQNYMIEHILRKNKQLWYKFDLQLTKVFSWFSIFTNSKNHNLIKSNSDEMINNNMIEAQRLVQLIVKERFGEIYSCSEGQDTVNTPYNYPN